MVLIFLRFLIKNEKGTSYFPDIVTEVEKYAKFVLVISQFSHMYYFQGKQKNYTNRHTQS